MEKEIQEFFVNLNFKYLFLLSLWRNNTMRYVLEPETIVDFF